MKRLSLIVLVLSFTFTLPTMAVDKEGQYISIDDYSCGQWVEDSKKEGGWGETVLRNWIKGFITAYNLQTPDVYNILGSTDMKSIYLWMNKYCHENPLGTLVAGMSKLTKELWPNRKRTKDD